jgi:uncharacterized protein (TIGR01777 family)
VVPGSLRDPAAAARSCENADAVVNLAGETIGQRWTPAVKDRIRFSRVDAPRALIETLSRQERRPRTYVSASAVGYYGNAGETTCVESTPPGGDFLAEVCVAWEAEARKATDHQMRVAILRNGIVLGTDGGALAAMLPVFRVGGGGPVASGRQWYSWIHIHDLVGMYLLALDAGEGIYNATAPDPVRNAEFTRSLAHALHRPTVVRVPKFALRLLLGEAADALSGGQRVLPQRMLTEGFQFAFAHIDDALENLLR